MLIKSDGHRIHANPDKLTGTLDSLPVDGSKKVFTARARVYALTTGWPINLL